MKRLLAVLSIAVAAIAIIGSAVHAQQVVLAIPRDTIPLYDTLYTVTATPHDVTGRRSPSSTVTWSTRPAGVVQVILTNGKGQSANLAALRTDTTRVFVQWKRSDGVTVRDSALVRVTKARVMSLAIFTRAANGAWEAAANLAIGQTKCVYGVAYDRRSGIITGKSFTLSSGDSTVASVGDGFLATVCPDTTVDLSRIP